MSLRIFLKMTTLSTSIITSLKFTFMAFLKYMYSVSYAFEEKHFEYIYNHILQPHIKMPFLLRVITYDDSHDDDSHDDVIM